MSRVTSLYFIVYLVIETILTHCLRSDFFTTILTIFQDRNRFDRIKTIKTIKIILQHYQLVGSHIISN